MGKGKGRRRRQANYIAAHGISANLPAPPPASGDAALPAKLRRIISLKISSAQGPLGVGIGKKAKVGPKVTDGNRRQRQKLRKEEGALNDRKQEQLGFKKDASSTEPPKPKEGKKRIWENELLALSEKFKATPFRKGLNERKKRYLKEKRNKRKRSTAPNTGESDSPLHEQERISFGDIVEAPPSLNFPRKQMTVAEERVRQQAITTYREKKKWFSRPGSHHPPLASAATMGS